MIEKMTSGDGTPLVRTKLRTIEGLFGVDVSQWGWLLVLTEDDGETIIMERGAFITMCLILQQHQAKRERDQKRNANVVDVSISRE